MNLIDGHDCITCKSAGHCSLEPVIRYFKNHESEYTEFATSANTLMKGSWLKTMVTDMLAIESKSSDQAKAKGSTMDVALFLAMAMGWLMAKGINPALISMSPDPNRVLRAVMNMMKEVKPGEGIPDKANRN